MTYQSNMDVPYEIEGTVVTLSVDYNYTDGSPAQGPSYSSGGQPADPPEIEITSITVGCLDVPPWLFKILADDGNMVTEYLHEKHEAPMPPERERDDD